MKEEIILELHWLPMEFIHLLWEYAMHSYYLAKFLSKNKIYMIYIIMLIIINQN